MWPFEACWINFDAGDPFLVTMISRTINALTSEPWPPTPGFEAEDYLQVPDQARLDGFTDEQGAVRQFVTAPLGSDYAVEEQLSLKPARGGIHVAVYPLLPSKCAGWEDTSIRFYFSAPPNDATGLGVDGSVIQAMAAPVDPHDPRDVEHGRRLTTYIVNSAV